MPSVPFVLAPIVRACPAIALSTGPRGRSGSYHLQLEGPDNASSPSLWQGPLRISRAARSCSAHVSLVSAVWAAPHIGFLIVITESGSSTYVHFIDLATCLPKWQRLDKGVSVVCRQVGNWSRREMANSCREIPFTPTNAPEVSFEDSKPRLGPTSVPSAATLS